MFRGQKKKNRSQTAKYCSNSLRRTDYIYHDGASLDCRPIADAGLLAGVIVEIEDGKRASSRQWSYA